jgi:NitT/TauT family transport system permease protein
MRAPENELAQLEAGLDALELARAESPLSPRRVVAAIVPRVIAVIALAAAWQAAVSLSGKPSYILPGPADVAASLAEQWQEGHVLGAVFNSLGRAAAGYAVSILVGTALGLSIARASWLRTSVGSLVSALQSLPSVVWVPLGLVLFGIKPTTIYFVVVMGAFPSIANGVVSAYDQIPPLLLRVGRAMGAGGPALYRHVIIPASMPGYLAGLKQAWSFSWRSLMAAELIARSPELGLGLGQLLDTGRQFSDISLVVASILVILVVGVVVEEAVFAPLERGIRRRRGLAVSA